MGSRKEIKQLKNSIIDSFVFILRQISSIIEVLSLFDSFNYCYNIILLPQLKRNESKIKKIYLLFLVEWSVACCPFN